MGTSTGPVGVLPRGQQGAWSQAPTNPQVQLEPASWVPQALPQTGVDYVIQTILTEKFIQRSRGLPIIFTPVEEAVVPAHLRAQFATRSFPGQTLPQQLGQPGAMGNLYQMGQPGFMPYPHPWGMPGQMTYPVQWAQPGFMAYPTPSGLSGQMAQPGQVGQSGHVAQPGQMGQSSVILQGTQAPPPSQTGQSQLAPMQAAPTGAAQSTPRVLPASAGVGPQGASAAVGGSQSAISVGQTPQGVSGAQRSVPYVSGMSKAKDTLRLEPRANKFKGLPYSRPAWCDVAFNTSEHCCYVGSLGLLHRALGLPSE